ncbi:MAG: hypothetical protein AB7P76_09930 [Candidatus Melainabacteria bacterium]
MAAGLFTLGMMTHQLPVRARPGKSLLPADWKAFFRIGSGIVAVNQLNKAMDWHPSTWQGALEAVTVINPLALGISNKSVAQMVVMAPLVTGVVQAATFLNEKVTEPLKEKLHIPTPITRLALSLGFAGIGIMVYPQIFKVVAHSGLLGRGIREEVLAGGAAAVAGSAMVTCARGCSPGSVVCLSETAEMMGGMANWFKSHFGHGTSGNSNNSVSPSLAAGVSVYA